MSELLVAPAARYTVRMNNMRRQGVVCAMRFPTIARGVTATTADRRGEERKRERRREH